MIAETIGGPRYSEELFHYEPVLEIRQNPENPESLLNRPYPFATDRRGFVFVPDPFNHRIVVYDSVGNFVQQFGRAGEGPTDFQFPLIHAFHNDVLSVFDSQLGRTTLYSTDGDLIEVVTMPGGYSRALEALFLLPGNGDLLAFRRHQDRAHKDGIWKYVTAVVMDRAGNLRSTIETYSALESYEVPASPGFSAIINTIPIGTRAVFAYLPDVHFLLSCGSLPLIDLYELTGMHKIQIKINLPVQPVTESERQAIYERFDRIIDRYPDSLKPQKRREREYLILPDEKGYWDWAFIDEYGYIWLRIPELSEIRNELRGPSFRVLSPEGEYLGTTRWPCMDGRIQDSRFLGLVSKAEIEGLIPTVFNVSPMAEGFQYP